MLGTIDDPKFRVGPFVLKADLLVFAIVGVLKLIGCTLRIRLDDRAGWCAGEHPEPQIIAFWHNRILAMPFVLRKYYGKRKGAVVLTSASGEGTVLSRVVAAFGVGSVRGSSSRQGASAAKELGDKLRDGFDVVVTPDGPRGPCYELGPGVVFLAQRTGAPLLAVKLEYSSYWRLKTWDRFMIPKPFSRVEVVVEKLVYLPKVETQEELEVHRKAFQQLLQPQTR